jgi:hypothetical protein
MTNLPPLFILITTSTQLATPGAERKRWVEEWIKQPVDQWDWREKMLVYQDWEKRWHAENSRLGRIVRPGIDPGGRGVVSEDTRPTKQMLKLHKGLQKAESALLTQARTWRIGLAKFPHKRGVPGFTTATCQCRAGYGTPRHMALYCIYEAGRRHFFHVGKKRTYTQLVGTNEGAKHFARWMMHSGRLKQFALAKRLLYDSE